MCNILWVTLTVNYAFDFRRLNFLQKLSVHHSSVTNLLLSSTARKEFELLCKNYSVTYGRKVSYETETVYNLLVSNDANGRKHTRLDGVASSMTCL